MLREFFQTVQVKGEILFGLEHQRDAVCPQLVVGYQFPFVLCVGQRTV